jgi:hypothetical protein
MWVAALAGAHPAGEAVEERPFMAAYEMGF